MLRAVLDPKVVTKCHRLASEIAAGVEQELSCFSTVAVERAVLRLMGVTGVSDDGVPLANVLVDHLKAIGKLEQGAAIHLANAVLSLSQSPVDICRGVAQGKVDLSKLSWQGIEACTAKARELAKEGLDRIALRKREREEMIASLSEPDFPWLYVIVATGNIYEDIVQAKMAAAQGADVIAVIRSTGQSLLDYVPFGATTEGFGGTYATQENFQLMRSALDEESQRLGRYVRLVNYCSGLCMPEIAAMGALERLDVMLNDAMYGILFRDINAERTLIDQQFSRMINAYAGIIINTGEDNYLTTVDALNSHHSVLSSQFINYHFAKRAGLKDGAIGLGHAFQVDPWVEDSLTYELAPALLVREIFSECPIKYMPPTVHKSGDIFFAHALDASFNLVTMLSGQSIHLVGMLTEAVHTPLLQDRYISIKAAKYMRRAAKHLRQQLSVVEGSLLSRRAPEILSKTESLLNEVRAKGLFRSLEEGVFAGISRKRSGGRGREGVFRKGPLYQNPFFDEIRMRLSAENADSCEVR